MGARAWMGLVGGAGLSLALGAASCQQNPDPPLLRSMDRPQHVDFVCMQVRTNDADRTVIHPPLPVRRDRCSAIPTNESRSDRDFRPFHLYALVTQTVRGEVAVVDLTLGSVVDSSSAMPNVNLLVVGSVPTGLVSTPDGAATFVATADPNKPAIFALPSSRILGDFYSDQGKPQTIADWPVCALPESPGPVAIVARPGTTLGYELVVVLPGSIRNKPQVLTLDPAYFGIGDTGVTPFAPGKLEPCARAITSTLVLDDAVPSTWTPGPSWPDGVPYVDGGVDLTGQFPAQPSACTAAPPSDAGADAEPADAGDAGDDGGDAGAPPDGGVDASAPDAGEEGGIPVQVPTGAFSHASAAIADGTTLYVADDGLPLVHVIDLSTPGKPTELAPYVATSVVQPERRVTVGALTLSPPTRDYRRYLYALDGRAGSVMVFDATDPRTAPRTPMRRPHAELAPGQSPDRIAFDVPVAAMTFVRTDVPDLTGGTSALCLPSASARTENGAEIEGARGNDYRLGGGLVSELGPARLRGIFALLTLANGQIVVVDVDDWDTSCRRPAKLDGTPTVEGASRGALAVPQATDLASPYNLPAAFSGSVTKEVYFPVSAPHRLRSSKTMILDGTTTRTAPYSLAAQILQGDTPLGAMAPKPFLDVKLAYDLPDVALDQDWTFVYEGQLTGFNGLVAPIATTDAWATLTFDRSGGGLCARGVEDRRLGASRARDLLHQVSVAARAKNGPCDPRTDCSALAERDFALPPGLEERLGDYVVLNDEILPESDGYWRADAACWGDPEPDPNDPNLQKTPTDAAGRRALCKAVFGEQKSHSDERHLPILEAYDDRLVVGVYTPYEPTPALRKGQRASTSRERYRLQLAQCCFHAQSRFQVRTGGEWLAVGSAVGVLHDVTVDPATKACVWGCDARNVLKRSRTVGAITDPGPDGRNVPADTAIGVRDVRDSLFYVRNPFLAALPLWPSTAQKPVPEKDLNIRLQVRGGFTSQRIPLVSGTVTQVSPLNMAFIEPLQQVVVVDGATQGLMIVDLRSLKLVGTYF